MEKSEPKIGDKVYYHTDFIEFDTKYHRGKFYEVTCFGECWPHTMGVKGDTAVWLNNCYLGFKYPKEFDMHFYNLKELRKEKLKKLEYERIDF